DAGGGGERVLWTAIDGIMRADGDCRCIVYAWDRVAPGAAGAAAALDRVKDQFDIEVDASRLHFVRLRTWRWLEAKRYPRLTLIAQSLGSLVTGWEAMQLLIPDVFVDTIGFAFVYPLVKKLYGVAVTAYVHYPTISSDMLKVVQDGTEAFNNSGATARNPLFRNAKLV
ncbi:asparagine-linked glycosylation protein, partial [Cladochytrium tenue]